MSVNDNRMPGGFDKLRQVDKEVTRMLPKNTSYLFFVWHHTFSPHIWDGFFVRHITKFSLCLVENKCFENPSDQDPHFFSCSDLALGYVIIIIFIPLLRICVKWLKVIELSIEFFFSVSLLLDLGNRLLLVK